MSLFDPYSSLKETYKVQSTAGAPNFLVTMSNATDRTSAFASLNLGGSLIEIAALTALIGSTTAESLVLGNKGAVGLLESHILTYLLVSACPFSRLEPTFKGSMFPYVHSA